jgi:cyclase
VSSTADDHPGLGPPRTVEVSDGVFAYVQPDGSWWINNTGFLVGRRAVTSVDACSTEWRTRAYLGAIAAVTPLPVQTLVNTHHHGDHTNGNSWFRDATIVGHHRTREEIQAAGILSDLPFWTPVDWGDLRAEPPTLTFSEGVTLWVDDLRCEVRHLGVAAHTTNDSVVWLPDRRVLFSGDLVFNGGTPFLLMGSVAGAIETLGRLRGFDAEVIVPGHGEPCGPGAIDDCLAYLTFVRDLAAGARAAGLSPLEAAREADLGPFSHLLDAERIVGNLHRAYAELDGAAPGAAIDVPGALADMVTYNGGRPLSCWA